MRLDDGEGKRIVSPSCVQSSSPIGTCGFRRSDRRCVFARLVARRPSDAMVVSPVAASHLRRCRRAVARPSPERISRPRVGARRARRSGRAAMVRPSLPDSWRCVALGSAVLLLDPLAPVEDRRRAVEGRWRQAVLDCCECLAGVGRRLSLLADPTPAACDRRAPTASPSSS